MSVGRYDLDEWRPIDMAGTARLIMDAARSLSGGESMTTTATTVNVETLTDGRTRTVFYGMLQLESAPKRNPFAVAHWDVTAQGVMVRDKGELYAARVASLAGTTLGGKPGALPLCTAEPYLLVTYDPLHNQYAAYERRGVRLVILG